MDSAKIKAFESRAERKRKLDQELTKERIEAANKQVIERLEQLLKMAKDRQIVSLAIAAVFVEDGETTADHILTGWGGAGIANMTMLGALEVLKQEYLFNNIEIMHRDKS